MYSRALPSFLVLAFAACALEPLGDDAEPETGPGTVFTLVSVNGSNLPAQVVQSQSVLEVARGALTLGTDSAFIFSYIVRARGGSSQQVSTVTLRGRYGIANSVLQLRVLADSTVRYRGPWTTTDVTLTDVSVPNGDQFGFRR